MPEPIVGRDMELVAIQDFVAQLGELPRALVISGEPGIGKTTLWRAMVERARLAGYEVLQTRPLQADARRSFIALADLLRDVKPSHLERLPAPQAYAIDVVCLRADPGRGVDHTLIATAVLSLLVDMAKQHPLLLAIDDIQWLDRPSARVLEFVGRRLSGSEVLFGVAMRVEFGEAAQALPLEASLGIDRILQLNLAGLPAAVLADLIASRLGRQLPLSVTERIEQASSGNPLFALDIARELPKGSDEIGAFPVPSSVFTLTSKRIRRLPALSQHALLAAAALSVPRFATVIAATGAKLADASAALEAAERARLINVSEFVEFAHPVIAAAAYEAATPAQRVRMHRRLSALVDDPEERARHLAKSTLAPDEDVAAEIMSAARQTALRGAPWAASELASAACALTPASAGAALGERMIESAQFAFYAGDLVRSEAVLRKVMEVELPDPSRARALRILGDVLSRKNSMSAAISAYSAALDLSVGAPALRAEIELAVVFATVSLGDFATAESRSVEAIEAAERAADPGILAEALAVAAMCSYLLGRGRDSKRIDQALSLEDDRRASPLMMRPSLIAALLDLYDGVFDPALSTLDTVVRAAGERGQEIDLSLVLAYRAFFKVWQGELDVAHLNAHEAARMGRENPSVSAYVRGIQTYVHGWMGDHEATSRDAAATEAAVEASNYRVALLWSRTGLAERALAADRPREALAGLGELVSLLESNPRAEPMTLPFAATAVEALIATRQLGRAEAILEGLEETANRLSRAWARVAAVRCRAALLTAQGSPAESLALIAQQLNNPVLDEFPLHRARLQLVQGRAARALRKRREAAAAYTAAEETFATCGAHGWVQRAHAERERLGMRPADGQLTPRERAVANLSAAGLTNREVATQLSISVKTVEATLGRAYEKLGIHSRAQLGALRGDLTEPDERTA
jgi:DNA-binding CsgD family transcriptional regulator/predicted negative regulator of RcsB-dependent stress response